MSENTGIAFYYDEPCTQMMQQGVVKGRPVWIIDFGRIDAGKQKEGTFYMRNVSNSIIEDVNVDVSSALENFDGKPVAGVKAELVSNSHLSQFVPDESEMIVVRWTADSQMRASRCRGYVSVRGHLLEEGYRPPP